MYTKAMNPNGRLAVYNIRFIPWRQFMSTRLDWIRKVYDFALSATRQLSSALFPLAATRRACTPCVG
nr:hypothetical protein SYMBAF_50435 [Serratia symbiotica]